MTDLAGLARGLFPGGATTAIRIPGNKSIVVARGEGSKVWTVEGEEYVDFLLGSGPLILGHAHPEVVDAVTRQVKLGSTFYALNEPIIRLGQALVGAIPCAEMIQFCTSGSEATQYAMRIARAATGRPLILKFEGGFHGSNDYALMSMDPSGPANYPHAETSSAGIPDVVSSQVLVAPYNDLGITESILDEFGGSVAAILVEPYQRAIAPLEGFLAGLRELASRSGAVLIFDELVTGFRLAWGGAQELYGVTPDLATYGKVIGGGYPLAAVAGRRELMAYAGRAGGGRGAVYFSGTLNGNPVAAAAGLATLNVLARKGSYEELEKAGEYLRGGMAAAFDSCGIPAQVIGVGPTFQAFVTDQKVVDYRASRSGDTNAMSEITEAVFRSGIFYTGGKGYISLVHTREDLDAAISAFTHAVSAVRAIA